MDVYSVRRENMRSLLRERTTTELAKLLGYKGPSYISQMAGKNPDRPITEDNARKFEKLLHLDNGWFDAVHDAFGKELPISLPKSNLSSPGRDKPANQEAFDRCIAAVSSVVSILGFKRISHEQYARIVWELMQEDTESTQALERSALRYVKIVLGSIS